MNYITTAITILIILTNTTELLHAKQSTEHNRLSCISEPIELPKQAEIELVKLIAMFQNIYVAMEQGDIKAIQVASQGFSKALLALKEPVLQEQLAPSLTYAKVMSTIGTYQEARAIYKFMVAPLFQIMPYTQGSTSTMCTKNCTSEKHSCSTMGARTFSRQTPPLTIPIETSQTLFTILKQYNSIHNALYNADAKIVKTKSAEIATLLQTIELKALTPYIQALTITAKKMAEAKTVEKVALLFSTFSTEVQELVAIIRPRHSKRMQ